ncbi:MAG: putative Ig domain-containing protein [Dehalococcoidia bacterium]|nr:putative Ig domain-containing protein [Dehalococcoidia bacterium]MDD5494361.1 putative Ig domain-containing protein [Dehalococcoidia bacterium]
MRISNVIKGWRAAGFFRIFICILIALTLVTGGMALTPHPVEAAIDITTPGGWNQIVPACVPFTIQFTSITPACTPPPNPFFWLGPGTPVTWTVVIDPNTGLLTGTCPPLADVGSVYMFEVGVTEFDPSPCGPFAASHTLTLTVGPPPVTTPLTITPTIYPAAWENMPYTITLTATGCSATPAYNWTATGLPTGLTLDPNTGILSGIPAPGTCGPWTTMVTCTDTSMCALAGCCPPVTAPLYLFVDCWANYLAMINTYYTTGCDFKVNIGPGLTYGQTNVIIDGTSQATLGGGNSETFTSIPCENHLVIVDQIVQGPDPKTRYSCIGSNQQWVTDIDNSADFNYVKEVYVDTASDPAGIAQPSGAGFYAVGNDFSSTAPSPVTSSGEPDTKYLFSKWVLPDSSTSLSRDLVFTVNQIGSAVVKYDTYYLFNLKSDYPPIDESSWELKDSTATYSLSLQDVPIPNFWGFIGGKMRPVNASGSHLMTGSYTQKIEWYYDYTIPIILLVVALLVIAGIVFLVLRRKGPVATAAPATTLAQVAQPSTVVTEAAKTTPTVAATDEQKALSESGSKEKPNFCPKCGAPVEPDASFCKKCGKKLL